MYGDSIKTANKIITRDDLLKIFTKMQEKLTYYQKVNAREEAENQVLNYQYQAWTFKDVSSGLHFNISFHDGTQINFDNYDIFISTFSHRLAEIKSIYVNFTLSYSVKPEEQKSDYYNQHINMAIYEDNINVNVSLSSTDKKIDEIYELIKEIISSAPPKYDNIIQKRGLISIAIGLAIGFIPALIATTLLLFIPAVRNLYATGYIVFPILNLLLAFAIGKTVSPLMLGSLYKNIIPEQKYAGHDSNYQSVYEDDVNRYVETSEVLIGKNSRNLENRNQIKLLYAKYKKWLPYELSAVALISVIVLFLK